MTIVKIENRFNGEIESYDTYTAAYEAMDTKPNPHHWDAICGITGGELRRYHGEYDKSEWVFALRDPNGGEHIMRGEK